MLVSVTDAGFNTLQFCFTFRYVFVLMALGPSNLRQELKYWFWKSLPRDDVNELSHLLGIKKKLWFIEVQHYVNTVTQNQS